MQRDYDTYKLAKYVLALARSFNPSSYPACVLMEWLESEGWRLDLYPDDYYRDSDQSFSNSNTRHRLRQKPRGVKRDAWQQVLTILSERVESLSGSKKHEFDRNLDILASYLELDDNEKDIIDILSRYKKNRYFEDFSDQIIDAGVKGDDFLSRITGVPLASIQKIYSANSRLCSIGLMSGNDSNGYRFEYMLSEEVLGALLFSKANLSTIKSKIIGRPCRASLQWNDFQHIGQEASLIKRILEGALNCHQNGINILLYGPPGTGKTEFCKTLAKSIGVDLYSIGEKTADDEYARTGDRLNALRRSQAILSMSKPSLLLFDEMEDLISQHSILPHALLFGTNRGHVSSKVYVNRLLEENTVPVLWTTNSLEEFDKAILRRMTFALEIRQPPQRIREKVWRRTLAKEKVSLPERTIIALSQDKTIMPSLASNTAMCMRLSNGNEEDAESVINGLCKAMRYGEGIPEAVRQTESIKLDFLQTDLSTTNLTSQLTESKSKQFSLCLYGPPGTGKSAYIRYLANQMGMELIHKRASDLLSPYVGMAEKNIAAAFQEAIDNEAFLIIDEADSLLQNRSNARNSWEVTQVNEMLTWMEAHPLPFACTTNLMDALDPASLRRFTFKIEFDYLTHVQAKQAFQHFFQQTWPDKLVLPDTLTPGDFVVVKRKADTLVEKSPYKLANWLIEECRHKPGYRQAIGFHAG